MSHMEQLEVGGLDQSFEPKAWSLESQVCNSKAAT